MTLSSLIAAAKPSHNAVTGRNEPPQLITSANAGR